MQASIIRCVHSYNFDRLIYENDPQVAAETDIPAEIFETVIQGMVDASRIGTHPQPLATIRSPWPSKNRYARNHRLSQLHLYRFRARRGPADRRGGGY
jgi:hypothetical protein